MAPTYLTLTGEAHLKRLLRKDGIPYEHWGEGTSKEFNLLMTEYSRTESRFHLGPLKGKRRLIRDVNRVQARIFHGHGLARQYLIEEYQLFTSSGEKRVRSERVSASEKIGENESLMEGLIRLLVEELGLSEERVRELIALRVLVATHIATIKTEPAPSKSYTGLPTIHRNFIFRIDNLPDEFYNPDGYTEHRPYKITKFKWRSVKNRDLD